MSEEPIDAILAKLDTRFRELETEIETMRKEQKTMKEQMSQLLHKKYEWVWALHARPVDDGIGHLAGIFSSHANASQWIPPGNKCFFVHGLYRYEIEKRKPEPEYDFKDLDEIYPSAKENRGVLIEMLRK